MVNGTFDVFKQLIYNNITTDIQHLYLKVNSVYLYNAVADASTLSYLCVII